MAENLPIMLAAQSSQELFENQRYVSTLLGRGLAAIQNKKLIISDEDARYRIARDTFNQITSYGLETCEECNTLWKGGMQTDFFTEATVNKLQPLIDKKYQLTLIFGQLKQLADQGYGKAYFIVSEMLLGCLGVMRDIDKSRYFAKLATQWLDNHQTSNDPEIWVDLACVLPSYSQLDHEEKWDKVYFLHRKAAEYEDTRAQYFLGEFFKYDENDYQQAFFWFQNAAAQGHARAQYELGEMYLEGLGVEQNGQQAVFWFQKAGEQGNHDALYNLGKMYLKGLGVEQNGQQAVFWFQQAVGQGSLDALYKLSKIFLEGDGVEHNEQLAEFWLHMFSPFA